MPATRDTGRDLRRQRLLFWLLVAALSGAQLAPFFSSGPLPLRQVPSDLALLQIWIRGSAHYDATLVLVPGWLYVVLLRGLAALVGVVDASRCLLGAYVLLTPLSVIALARAAGRPRWQGLVGFAGIYGVVWSHGLGAHLLSAVPFFLGAAALIKLLDDTQPRWQLALAGALLVTVWLSFVSWAILVGAILMAARRPHARPLALAIGPSLAWLASGLLAAVDEPAWVHLGEPLFAQRLGVWPLVSAAPGLIFDGIGNAATPWILFALCASALGTFIALRQVESTEDAHRRVLRALLFATGLAYLYLPATVIEPLRIELAGGRALLFVLPLALLRPALDDGGWRRLALVPLVAVAIAAPLFARATYETRRPIAPYFLAQKVLPTARLCVLRPGDPLKSSESPASVAGRSELSALLPLAVRDTTMIVPPLVGALAYRSHVVAEPPRYSDLRTYGLRAGAECDDYLIEQPVPMLDRDGSIERKEQIGDWVRYHRVRGFDEAP